MTKEREDETEAEDLDFGEGQQADEQPEISTKDEGGETVVEVQRESRKERREREQAERTLELIEQANKPLRDQLAMMAQMRQAPVQQQAPAAPVQQQTGADPEWRKLVQEQTRIVSLVRASNDPAEIKRLEDEWHDAEYRKGQIVASKEAERVREQFRRENPPAEDPVHKLVRSEFADVLNYGPDATSWATSLFAQEKIKAFREKRPFDEMATHRRVLQQTAEEFNLRPKALPARNPVQQGRFSSLSASSAKGSGGDGAARPLTKEEKRMAIAFAGNGVPEAKAYTDWAKMMGPEYFANK
jgi:hypothetical protein